MYFICLRFSNCPSSQFQLTGLLKTDRVWQLKWFEIIMEGSSGLLEVKHCLWSQEWTAPLISKSRQQGCDKEPQSLDLWLHPTWSALPKTPKWDFHALVGILSVEAVFIVPGYKQGWAVVMTIPDRGEKSSSSSAVLDLNINEKWGKKKKIRAKHKNELLNGP